MLIVNPQWVTEGNVVSDLGFLPWARKANEELIASFQEVGARGMAHAARGPWEMVLSFSEATLLGGAPLGVQR